ncbi:MAG: dihydroorotate dehydrogenase [Candidatus Levybacteria bacterium]|nr:dihydroorotate dehydrogenase [Candidatus Levybacteria bacterium]MBI4097582.1 dihydroorotate dehydrogenase [Candidatus Levybacteria bacterium]
MAEIFSPVDIGSIHLETPIMNGAGPVKLPEHVLEIARSDAGAIVLGSITIEERFGNAGVVYARGKDDIYSLNSKGLPNGGLFYYRDKLPELVSIAHDHGKPLIVSIAGFSPEEYARLSDVVINSGVDGQELNLGCPNVWGKDGKQKRIASFDEDLTGETLRQVEQAVGPDAWTAVKLSPFSDPIALQSIANILSQSRLVTAVTSTNTFPNAFSFNEEDSPAIDPGGGLSGLAGKALKPIGIGQVRQLRSVLPSAIAIIGVGGISNSQDVFDYLRAGADATQITTAYINFGSQIFRRARGNG